MFGFAATQHQRHQPSVAGVLQVADHVHAAKSAIQQQITWADAGSRRFTQQALQHGRQSVVATHRREGDREASAFADDVGGGIGMEVAGAVLGLAAVNFLGTVPGLAVIGDEGKVDS